MAVGDHADGFGFADLEGVGVAEGFELGGLLTDQVVEGREVEGVAGDLEVGGADPVVGTVGGDPAVVQPHSPGVPALLLPGLEQVRVVGGDGLGDGGLDGPPPTRADPVRELGVDAAAAREVVGGLGDLAGFHGATAASTRPRAGGGGGGQGVGQQLQPGQGGHPEGRRTVRVPAKRCPHASRLRLVAQPLSAGSRVARWRCSTHHCAASEAASAFQHSVAASRPREQPSASRSATSIGAPTRRFRSCVQPTRRRGVRQFGAEIGAGVRCRRCVAPTRRKPTLPAWVSGFTRVGDPFCPGAVSDHPLGLKWRTTLLPCPRAPTRRKPPPPLRSSGRLRRVGDTSLRLVRRRKSFASAP